jgi:hypothetical protein
MPIPATRGLVVNDAGTLTMMVLPAQAPRLAAALTGRSGWCRSRSSPHTPRPRHRCGASRNSGLIDEAQLESLRHRVDQLELRLAALERRQASDLPT